MVFSVEFGFFDKGVPPFQWMHMNLQYEKSIIPFLIFISLLDIV